MPNTATASRTRLTRPESTLAPSDECPMLTLDIRRVYSELLTMAHGYGYSLSTTE